MNLSAADISISMSRMSSPELTSSSTRRSYLRRLAAASGLSVTGLAGCTGIPSGNDPIPLAVLSDQSGALADLLEPVEDAVQLAVEEINVANGPLGQELELHIVDTESTQDGTVAAYEDLRDEQDIVAVVGPFTGELQTNDLIAAVTREETMQVNTAGIPSVAEQGYVTQDQELKLVGRTVANEMQMGVAAAYVLDDVVEADTAWFGWWEPPEEQMLLRAEELFDGEVIDWWESAFLGVTGFDEVVEADPDAYVYFGWDQEHHLEGLADAGYDGDIVFYRGFFQTDLDAYADLADGVYAVDGRPEPTDGTDAFWDRFNTDGMLDRDWPLAEAYDAVYLVALAIQQAGEVSGSAIAKHIQEVSASPGNAVTVGEFEEAKTLVEDDDPVHYLGASGHVDLNERLEPVYPQAVVQVHDGEAVDVEIISADLFERQLY